MIEWNDYKNFAKWEFDCSYTEENRMRPEFMEILQQIRTTYGKPMKVNSGYRDFTHPIERAKESPGEHTYGLACDIAVRGKEAMELLIIAYGYGIRRIGLYQNKDSHFIHIGMGDKYAKFPQAIWTP